MPRSCFPDMSQVYPLSREVVIKNTGVALQPAGVDISRYCGHNFRIRVVPIVVVVGTEESLIKTLGLLYVRVPREELPSLSKELSSAEKPSSNNTN